MSWTTHAIALHYSIDRTLGSSLSCRVGIEAKNNFIDEALQNPGLLFGEGGPLRHDHVFDAGFKQRDQVELAFAHDRAVCFNQRPFGFMESKKHAPFLKERRFR